MKQSTFFLIIGMTGVFAMLLAPSLVNAPTDAQKQNWQQRCSGPGSSSSSGPCPGSSENSPNKQQQNINPGGNIPPGQQVDERK
jgi:hypothetical protein